LVIQFCIKTLFYRNFIVTQLKKLNIVGYGYGVPEKFSGYGDDTQTTNGSLGIIGGSDAQVGEVPWQVSIQYYDGHSWHHFCGGTILGSRKIATAAHCCEGRTDQELRVVAAISNLKTPEETMQASTVKSFTMHPKYDTK